MSFEEIRNKRKREIGGLTSMIVLRESLHCWIIEGVNRS